jgi:hypothetical protein
MRKPDFARTALYPLAESDLRFLVENMPRVGGSYEEIASLLEAMPNTLESMLTSDYVYALIRDRRNLLLTISPFLLFGVLLRRSLDAPRTPVERRVINYLANLLALFVRTERLYRVEDGADPQAYVVELLQDLAEAEPRRQFVTYAHIGNYTLWLTGLQAAWLEHRHRYGRRSVDARYYESQGSAYFDRAAHHSLAREFGLDDVFLRLSMMFDHYRAGLERMRRNEMFA